MRDTNVNNGIVNESYAFPTSYAQQRLWFLHRLEPENSAYNIPAVFRLGGRLNVAAMEKSFHEIVRRHEALRTTFSFIEGEPKQIISSIAPSAMSMVDLRRLEESARESELWRRLAEETRRYFDLEKGPLFQVSLLLIDDEDCVLIINMHHIISDGWSVAILFRELAICYEAFCENTVAEMPELPIQYADYAIWQREWLQGEILERQLSYWKKQLAGIPAVLNLPTDRPRPAVQSFRGKRQTIELSKELSDELKALARQRDATLFMTLLAAFQALLYRYTGQEDIVVGSPIAGRNRMEIEGLIGFFVNTLVLRANFASEPTFTELLAQVKETTLGAYTHQDLPFEKLVEELQPERSVAISPLFQALFVLQNTPAGALNCKGLNVSPMRMAGETTKFDLTLSVHEGGPGLRAGLQYSTDLFDEATIARMLGHFETLLEGIVANPEQRISDLPILTEAEKHQVLVEWNETKRDYPKDKCIHPLFEEQVKRTPEAVAVVSEDRQLTYGELNTRANQLAHHLRTLGVGPEVLVGICMERSIKMIVALLGILKAGGAYVPLDPDYPKERLEFMLDDAKVGMVLTDAASRSSLPPTNASVICLDGDWEAVVKESQVNPMGQSTADGLAYVVYTSGSTGIPKAVEVRHRGVVRLLFGVDYVQLHSAQTILHLAPISFDAATFEVWGALLHGGKCVLFPGKVPSASELGAVLKKYHVNMLWLSAALFNTVINEAPQGLSGVRQLLIGGEALSVPHIRKALSLLPNTEIINGYGPTESTTFTCCYPIPRHLDDKLSSIPIGKPIGNTQVYILDPHLNPVPIGVAGELYIGGAGLSRGYLSRPEFTGQKFVANPFGITAGARLYKSGDLARYLPDGNIEFLGRIDNQVKIRGYRIELGEIEAVLGQHPALNECVVLAREDSPGDRRLVGYVVFAPGSNPTASELRSFLQQKLPEYMVPSAFVFLDTIPLTPNGKIDYKRLLAYGKREPMLNESYVPPRNFTESTIKKIWESALGVEKIGIHDNFFDLGGHSLLAVKVLSQLSGFYKLDLKPRCLFESPTIAQLAERIRSGNFSNAREHSRWDHLVALQPTDGQRPVFFVPGGAGGEEDLLRCAPLLRRIGSGYSIYALLSWNCRGAATVEKIAEEYLKEVRTVQPEGPYFLIGECISGIVAYEMAQQLIAQGQQIASITLLDTIRPTKRRYFSFQRSYYLKRLSTHRKHLQTLALREKMSYSLQMAKAMICRNGNRIRDNNLAGGYDYDKVLMSYLPRKYDFRMNLILSSDIYERRCDGGWADLVPAGINIVRSNARHVTYCTDHVDHTAAHLRECLAVTRQGAREMRRFDAGGRLTG